MARHQFRLATFILPDFGGSCAVGVRWLVGCADRVNVVRAATVIPAHASSSGAVFVGRLSAPGGCPGPSEAPGRGKPLGRAAAALHVPPEQAVLESQSSPYLFGGWGILGVGWGDSWAVWPW